MTLLDAIIALEPDAPPHDPAYLQACQEAAAAASSMPRSSERERIASLRTALAYRRTLFPERKHAA